MTKLWTPLKGVHKFAILKTYDLISMETIRINHELAESEKIKLKLFRRNLF